VQDLHSSNQSKPVINAARKILVLPRSPQLTDLSMATAYSPLNQNKTHFSMTGQNSTSYTATVLNILVV